MRSAVDRTCLSSGVSTWKVRSMTVVHCRQRMMNVLGLGRSVFISWHSDHSRGGRGVGRDREKGQCVHERGGRDRPAVTAIYLYRHPQSLLANLENNRCTLVENNTDPQHASNNWTCIDMDLNMSTIKQNPAFFLNQK